MEITDILPKNSYACCFKVLTWTKDSKPVDNSRLQIGEAIDGEPGWYEGFGVIVKRDLNKKLVEIIDTEYPNRSWVVSWENCWNVDVVEWKENNDT